MSDDTTMNVNGQEIGVLGLSIGATDTDNFGVMGRSNNWGGLFQHNTSGNEARLGGSTYAVRAIGDVRALNDVHVDGNIGIGSTAPEVRLQVSGGSDAGQYTGGGYVIVGQPTNAHMRLDGNEIMVLNGGDSLSAGSLFINDHGITTVGADVNLSATLGVQDEDATGYAFRVRVGTETEMLVWENGGTSLGSNSTNPPDDGLFVFGDVNVGNSNGATGYKMAVDGKIICEELRVQTSGSWPDYVFAEDYDLPSLDEVEKHIKSNSHLPGIPSACEVESEGILVGEMQKQMMEKIEELVLYTIQQQKGHERQQMEIEMLKAQNAKLQALITASK